jgi:hypothetical protein
MAAQSVARPALARAGLAVTVLAWTLAAAGPAGAQNVVELRQEAGAGCTASGGGQARAAAHAVVTAAAGRHASGQAAAAACPGGAPAPVPGSEGVRPAPSVAPAPAAPAPAGPAPQGPPAPPPAVRPGTVVALGGTPHLWIADDRGVLHWASDTRALGGRYVDWSDRVDVALDQLRGLPRGEPWLSTALVKDGDPLYLPKWEAADPLPRLLHIRSIADVELFGIEAQNYGRQVAEAGAWQQRYGVALDRLARGELPPAAAD